MTALFILYDLENASIALPLIEQLEQHGYTPWRNAENISLRKTISQVTVETALLSSATLLLLWSKEAAQSPWVQKYLTFAQRLQKDLVVLLLDETPLPTAYVPRHSLHIQASLQQSLPQLLRELPSINTTDPLIAMYARAGHTYISERKAAISQAAGYLQHEDLRERARALLEYLSSSDTITSVRDQARDALPPVAHPAQAVAMPVFAPQDVKHIFRVPCKVCKNTSYFDKRLVCKQSQLVRQGRVNGKKVSYLDLKCQHCPAMLEVQAVNCEGYV